MFDPELPTVVNAMCDLVVGIFEHLDIMANYDIDKRVKYT